MTAAVESARRRPGCPGPARCGARRPHCGHLALVESYRSAWAAWATRRDDAVPAGYPTELAQFADAHPQPLFRDWLIQWWSPSRRGDGDHL